MHKQIDVLDEDRYDQEVKVAKNENEVCVFVMEMNISCQNTDGSPLSEAEPLKIKKTNTAVLIRLPLRITFIYLLYIIY